jgi:hypothetical protein
MKLLHRLKKQPFLTKEQQGDKNATLQEALEQNLITREFTKDEDTFMFI